MARRKRSEPTTNEFADELPRLLAERCLVVGWRLAALARACHMTSGKSDIAARVRAQPPAALGARAAALIASALLLAGCSLAENGSPKPLEAVVAYSAQPDSLDPAKSASVEALSYLWSVYTPPLTYRHANGRAGTQLVPGLAQALPRISAGGRIYRFRFRRGLEYSDGTRLRASDFQRAIKRVLAAVSPGTRFFTAIAGAEDYLAHDDENRDLAGIEADDERREVTIRLTRPDGTFLYSLATTYAAPVSRSAPFVAGARPVAGIGPFRIASAEPNREVVLARSAASRLPHVPHPRLERIQIRIMPNARRQAEDVRRNRLDFMFEPVPADLRGKIRREHPERYEEFVTNSTYYFWLNSSRPPFDNAVLRRAVHLALDKPALARLYGGLLEPTCNFLPPDMPGRRELNPCPFGPPRDGGDIAAARTLVRAEDAEGTPVTVWGNSLSPTQEVTEFFADQLAAIGFDPKLKILEPSVYFQVIGGRRSERFHAGFGNWYQEFPHPASFMAAVRGDLITPTGNYNFSRTDLPALTRTIKRLQRKPRLSRAVLAAWAKAERRLVLDAGVVPFGHLRYTTFMSERMDFERCSPNHPVYLTDFARFCVRD